MDNKNKNILVKLNLYLLLIDNNVFFPQYT